MKIKIFRQLRRVFGWTFFWFNEEDEHEDVDMVYEFVYFFIKNIHKNKVINKIIFVNIF